MADRESTIATLVDRFLAWPLPSSVCSDLCVARPDYKFPRSGTNLLSAPEARQMIEYLLAHDVVAAEEKTVEQRLAALEQWAHEPFDFTDLIKRLERLERTLELR